MSRTAEENAMIEAVISELRSRLRIETETKSAYTGGMDGRSLYEDYTTIQLLLDGEVISGASLL